MLELRNEDGCTCPYLVCDVCQKTLTVETGHVLWNMDTHPGTLLHVHRQCHAAGEQRLQGNVSWVPLGAHLVYLLNNVGMTSTILQKARQQARNLSTLKAFKQPQPVRTGSGAYARAKQTGKGAR